MTPVKRVALAAAMVGMVLTMVASASAMGNDGPRLKQKKTAAIVEGDTAWVALSWEGRGPEITDFRITAEARTNGVLVSYPANTETYSSLMDNSTLDDREIDFTALEVEVPYGVRKVKLDVTATWEQSGTSQSKTFKVRVPVGRHKGADVALVTDSAGSVSLSAPEWLGVEWSGIAPRLEDVTMTVTGGASITYPADGTSTSLHYDNVLEDGETDVARFLLDASGLATGSHTLNVTLSYSKGGKTVSNQHVVTFDVTG